MPELWPEVAWVMEAFNELSWARPITMGGIGYIPIGEVAAWAAINDVEDAATLLRHIRALDAVYVQHYHEQQKADAERRKREHVQGRRQDERERDPGPARLGPA